jgi:hypothetical protein
MYLTGTYLIYLYHVYARFALPVGRATARVPAVILPSLLPRLKTSTVCR